MKKTQLNISCNIGFLDLVYLCNRFLIPLLYSGEIYDQLLLHHNSSKDLYASFQRLLVDDVEPALIIADLLEEKRVKED